MEEEFISAELTKSIQLRKLGLWRGTSSLSIEYAVDMVVKDKFSQILRRFRLDIHSAPKFYGDETSVDRRANKSLHAHRFQVYLVTGLVELNPIGVKVSSGYLF